MNLVDLAVLAILGVSALLGLSRGFVREMLGLGAWVAAGYGAYELGPRVQPAATSAIGNPDIGAVVAYAGTFLVLVIALSLVANLIGRAVRLSALGGLDRTFGLLFGLARGAMVLVAAYILGGAILPHPENWPEPLRQSRTVPFLYEGAAWVTGVLPPQIRPAVVAPPAERPTLAEDLLHATPEGRALGPRPARN